MRFLGKTFGALLVLALVGGLGVAGYFGVTRLLALFLRLDFQVAMVAAIGAVACLLAAMIIAGSIGRAGAQGRKAQCRADKAEAYKLFIGLWEELLRPGEAPKGAARLSRRMQDVNHLLVLHASTAVVKAHAALQELPLPEARAQFGDALIEIRKDLGLESLDLEAEDLAQLLLTEPDGARGSMEAGTRQDRQPRVSLASQSEGWKERARWRPNNPRGSSWRRETSE
ncbi:MAG TPA: hypothetical protein VNY05_24945 [Candidatus Acidoferrales bacterium]|jgi:hypothetical protein|nr:hypothetical protein [Candidatus Acidoferrales bacterium]